MDQFWRCVGRFFWIFIYIAQISSFLGGGGSRFSIADQKRISLGGARAPAELGTHRHAGPPLCRGKKKPETRGGVEAGNAEPPSRREPNRGCGASSAVWLKMNLGFLRFRVSFDLTSLMRSFLQEDATCRLIARLSEENAAETRTPVKELAEARLGRARGDGQWRGVSTSLSVPSVARPVRSPAT